MSHLFSQNGQSLSAKIGTYSWAGICLFIVGTLSLLTGCFNSEAMIASRQDIKQLSLLEEVDLGAFRVTLPQLPDTTTASIVDFHAFGRVAHNKISTVNQAIEEHGSEFRHRMLILVRELELSELEDPLLETLRTNILLVFNESVKGNPMQTVGFYRFALSSE